MSFFTGFAVSAVVYILLNKLFPTPGAFLKFSETDEGDKNEGEEGEGEDFEASASPSRSSARDENDFASGLGQGRKD